MKGEGKFIDLLKKLVTVPKAEADALEKKRKASARRIKRARKK